MYHQQNNSPSRNYQANIQLNAPQGNLSAQGPQFNANLPQTQFSSSTQQQSYNSQYSPQRETHLSAQFPSANITTGQYSTQGQSANLQGQGNFSTGNYSHSTNQETNFGRGPEVNINSGQYSDQNTYSGNQQFSGPEANISLGGQGNFNGPDVNVNIGGNQGNNNFDSGVMPTSPEQIRQFIMKRPYTQTLEGEDFTYSILPKKQQSFVMTNDRFLLLKGIELLGYSKEFPKDKQLPFNSMAEVPAPKNAMPTHQIEKVENVEEKLIIRQANKQKTVWEFICPSKRCAVEWAQKINEAVELYREFQRGGHHSIADFLRIRKPGNSFNSSFGTTNFEHKFESSPPREQFRVDPQPVQNKFEISPPRDQFRVDPQPVQSSYNVNINRNEDVSRSVFDSSGPQTSLNAGTTSFNVNTHGTSYNQTNYSPSHEVNIQSPIKTNQYDVNYQANQSSPPQTFGMNVNANYKGSIGSTQGSGRSYTVSSSSSLGRYPLGAPLGAPLGGQQQFTYQSQASNTRNYI